MVHNDYGCRYPGGHSVIDDGFVHDETAMPKGMTKSDTSWRPRTKPVKFEDLKVGDRVKYGALGEGKVSSISDGKVYVKFDKRKNKRCFKKKTAEAHMKIVLLSKEGLAKTASKEQAGASVRPVTKTKNASAQQTISKPLGRNPEVDAWAQKKEAFLGCQVRDRYRRVGLVVSIAKGKMRILFLPKGIEEEFVYPGALVDGKLVVLDRFDASAQQARQQYAAMAMKELMGKKHSSRGRG